MRLLSKAVLLCLTLAACLASVLVACGSTGGPPLPGHNEEFEGAIGLALTFANGATLTSLSYSLSNGTGADAGTGSIPLPTGNGPAPVYASTYEIAPVVPGTGYTVTLTGSSSDGTVICSGKAGPFTVVAQEETIVTVVMICLSTNDSGSVELNVTVQDCPTVETLTAINATASTVPPGNTSLITAAASGPNMAAVTYAFSIISGTGSISNQTNASNSFGTSSNIVFTCPANAEVDTIQVVTADQTAPSTCSPSITTAAVTVTCVSSACQGPVVGSGVEASPDTATGGCPAGQFNTGTLKDPQGNYCCSPIPCFGVGTGIVAIPDTGAGTCPAGSANTGSLTDAGGNFCCSTSATVSYSVVRVAGTLTGGASSQGTDGTATAVFVENHSLNLSTKVDTAGTTIALPAALSGTQQPFAYQSITAVGGTNDGALSLSLDGHYLALAGYDATSPGTTNVSVITTATSRVIARINAAGVVDTSTYFAASGAYVSGYIRSTATRDGQEFWTSGNDSTTGGIWYIPFGTAAGGTQLTPSCPLPTCNPAVTPPAVRVVNLFNGQLYGTADNTGTTMYPVLFAAGSGEPASPSITLTGLPSFPTVATTGADDISPWAFTFVGPNTVYIASDQAVSTGAPPNGIEKWTLAAGAWSLQTTFNLATGQLAAGQVGFRNLAVLATGGGSTTFIATTVEPGTPVPANHLAMFVDNGVYGTGAMTETGTLYLQAPTNTLYKGLALSPH
jgi:hypothetical protein